MWRDACGDKAGLTKRIETYFAELDLYTHMAYYVAKELHMNPADILDGWSVPALIVAYGVYRNEDNRLALDAWKNNHAKVKKEPERPPDYAVYFHGLAKIESE